MKIFTVVVTNNRTNLLERALKSISNQTRKPDFVIVISNSIKTNQLIEKKLCTKLGFNWLINLRTNNYAGALNTGIEHYLKHNKIENNTYFSSLDDDDKWDINYLYELENNGNNTDIILSNIIRDDSYQKIKLQLPNKLNFHSFLGKNPGIGGSNTFVRLKTLLKSGSFDESMKATVDRDVFVRLFLLKPTYKIINKHLVTLYVENNRKRVTTNNELKKKSYQYFFYKYQNIMNVSDKEEFFLRASTLFKVNKKDIDLDISKDIIIKQNEITFDKKLDFQFIIGFIAGDKTIALRIIQAIILKNITISKLIIINNLPNNDNFESEKELLKKHNIKFKIVDKSEWSKNLPIGYYGDYFKKYSKINSIPIGRTILQHHLYTETATYTRPVFWVIDDDISFTNTILNNRNNAKIDLFDIINKNINNCDALIGSVSKDPPLPFLSTIRGQLIDLYYSSSSQNKTNADYGNLRDLKDYYYDITDAHFNHLETPIYYHSNIKNDLSFIFSGKSVSRPCLQNEIKGEIKLVSNRGPNTLIFNRDLLRFYPVVNLEVNEKFVRRGDLLWALLNQLISDRKIIDHTFCIDQNRPLIEFDIKRELDKSANDIIGYAFNKAIIQTISAIKTETKPNRPKDIYESLNTTTYFNQFILVYKEHLSKRKSRFLMNYYRIEGLTELLNQKKETSFFLNQFSDDVFTKYFLDTITVSESETSLKVFLETLSSAIWTYEGSIKRQMETNSINKARTIEAFSIETELVLLGEGSEGIVFTDKKYVYKSFFSMKDYEWIFLQKIGANFNKNPLLEKLNFIEHLGRYYIKYPYREFKTLDFVNKKQLIGFLKSCRKNEFIFSNIKPINFIIINKTQLKLIDYGRSFEPFTEEKFVNMVKRAFLMLNFPKMAEKKFRKLTQEINNSKIPNEIKGWELFLKEVNI